MLTALRALSALALAIWLGGMLFFAAGVAPVAFGTLPSRELAGNVVNGSMARLHLFAYVAGVLLLASYALRAWLGDRGRVAAIKAGLAALMLGIALYSGFGISAPLAEIRSRVGTIDSLPPGDPTRARFAFLHQLSVRLMGLNMLLGVVVIVLEQLPASKKGQAR